MPTAPIAGTPSPSQLERLLRRDRALVAAALVVATVLCWAWIVPMARDMYGAMDGPSAWMMTTEWDATHTLLLFAMWAVMMAGMMLPSAAPLLLLYAGAARRREPARTGVPRVYALGGGYLLVWTGFSAAATTLQRWLSEMLVLTPMMEIAATPVVAGLLAFAGIYQLTPLKARCLDACRSPLSFIMRERGHGAAAAFRLGVDHGLSCLGCCWALMLLLFAGGVMNLTVIAALTIIVLVEKAAPFGGYTSRALGVALIMASMWMAGR